MSIFGKLLKTAFDVATVPIDLVKDGCNPWRFGAWQ